MAREAALQGIQTIYIPMFKSYVNEYLHDLGFTIAQSDLRHVYSLAVKMFGDGKDVSTLFKSLENPVDTVAEIVEDKT